MASHFFIGIVGGSGYTSMELLRILLKHPNVTVQHIFSRTEEGKDINEVFPGIKAKNLKFTKKSKERLHECHLVFYATPHQVAMNEVEKLLKLGIKVIDLSADFRLHDLKNFEKWYGTHQTPDLLSNAVYGLSELNRDSIKKSQLVANPGCYPTSIQLPLVPLLKEGLINPDWIMIDSKSGVSGAGKSLTTANLYTESANNFKAYAVGGHRHLPEIEQGLEEFSGLTTKITFVPHLVPMTRGIESTIYCKIKNKATIEQIYQVWEKQYSNEHFVNTSNIPPTTKSVRGSNDCVFSAHIPQDGDCLVISSVIDNLVKGASGQAVQNMNIMLGIDEKTSLDQLSLLA